MTAVAIVVVLVAVCLAVGWRLEHRRHAPGRHRPSTVPTGVSGRDAVTALTVAGDAAQARMAAAVRRETGR